MKPKQTVLLLFTAIAIACLVFVSRPHNESASLITTDARPSVSRDVSDVTDEPTAEMPAVDAREQLPQFIVYCLEDTTAEGVVLQEEGVRLEQAGRVRLRQVLIPGIDSPERGRIVDITLELDALGILGLPAAALIDPSGKVARVKEDWSSEASAAKAGLEDMLTRLEDRDAAFAEADNATGLERAAALHRGLQAVGDVWFRAYLDEAQAVVMLDPDNAAGLRGQYLPKLVEVQVDRIVQERVYPLIDMGRYADAATAVAQLRDALPVDDEQTQVLLGFEGQLLASAGDLTRGTERMERSIAIDPTSDHAARIRVYLATLK